MHLGQNFITFALSAKSRVCVNTDIIREPADDDDCVFIKQDRFK